MVVQAVAPPRKEKSKNVPGKCGLGNTNEDVFFSPFLQQNETVNWINQQKTPGQIIPYASGFYYDGCVIEQDGATPHTSRQTRKLLSENQIQVLQSPANSPDLWSIESL